MTQFLKQSTAYTFRLGPFVDDTDGKTAETGLTLSQADFRLSKAGGAFAQKNESTSGTHDENGYYTCILNTTDTNTLGTLDINVSESGALPAFKSFMVVPANVYDSLVGGSDNLTVDVTDWKNATAPAMTGDAFARLGAPAGASVSADVAAVKTQTAAIETDTQDIQSRIPAALVSGRIDASVGAMANNTMTAAAAASDLTTELQSGLATAASLATVAGYIDTEIGSIITALGTIDDFLDTEIAAIKVKTDNLPTDPADQSDIVNAIGAAIPDIAIAVWEETLATHSSTVGSTAEQLAAAGAAGDPWATALPGSYGSGTAGKIVGDNINATVSSRATQTSVDTVDTVVDAVKVVTDRLNDTLEDDGGTYRFTANALEEGPAGGGGGPTASEIADEVQTRTIAAVTLVNGLAANSVSASALAADAVAEIQSGLALAADLATVAGYVDGEITAIYDRIGAPVGASISADVAAVKTQTAAIETDTQDIQSRIPAALVSGRMDSSTGAMAANVMTSAATAANYVSELQNGLATQTSVDDLPTNAELTTALAAADDAVLAAIAALSIPTANQNADALLDRAAGVETGWTLRQAMRILLSINAGKASGMETTTAVFRDMADSKDRITATVDADGNRTAVTRDAT